ncbi:HAD family hydrolase (plasmid) [Legionella sp. D16C41]|uniref:HAD family hydrolase n=1 Tax=Legionella sp. D16C41 TaxID=3402688 RepID=UPI003AF7EC29
MNIELIIFDNDGVLIDSEIIWHQFFIKQMTLLGYTMSITQSLKLFSTNYDKPIEEVLKNEFGLTNMEMNLSIIGNQTEANYSTLLKPVHDIQLVLDFIDSKKIKKCIASNGDFEYIKNTLNITGLKKYFNDECIIGVEDKTQRKPEPFVFIEAAKKFSVSAEQCLVIEDHALGILAAKNAQMKVIGFLGASHAQNDEHRNWLVNFQPNKIVNNSLELLRELISTSF